MVNTKMLYWLKIQANTQGTLGDRNTTETFAGARSRSINYISVVTISYKAGADELLKVKTPPSKSGLIPTKVISERELV